MIYSLAATLVTASDTLVMATAAGMGTATSTDTTHIMDTAMG